MEITVSKDVQQRLDKINWDNLKDKYGISREAVMSNPHIASQLAYGQMTDLIHGYTKELSGQFSLRAYPTGKGETWEVKVFTMEITISQSLLSRRRAIVYHLPTSKRITS